MGKFIPEKRSKPRTLLPPESEQSYSAMLAVGEAMQVRGPSVQLRRGQDTAWAYQVMTMKSWRLSSDQDNCVPIDYMIVPGCAYELTFSDEYLMRSGDILLRAIDRFLREIQCSDQFMTIQHSHDSERYATILSGLCKTSTFDRLAAGLKQITGDGG